MDFKGIILENRHFNKNLMVLEGDLVVSNKNIRVLFREIGILNRILCFKRRI